MSVANTFRYNDTIDGGRHHQPREHGSDPPISPRHLRLPGRNQRRLYREDVVPRALQRGWCKYVVCTYCEQGRKRSSSAAVRSERVSLEVVLVEGPIVRESRTERRLVHGLSEPAPFTGTCRKRAA